MECVCCRKTYASVNSYNNHLLTEKHKKKSQKLTCACGKTFSFRQGLSRHKKKCSYMTPTQVLLQSQILIVQLIETFATIKENTQLEENFLTVKEKLQDAQEKNNELEQSLEQKEVELANLTRDVREKTLIEQFPRNVQCVYYGMVDNVSNRNEKLIKFGNSNGLKGRTAQHKDTYENFYLVNAFKVDNKQQIENALKEAFKGRLRSITIKDKKYVELLNMEGMTFEQLDVMIKEVIQSHECSPENYAKVMQENAELKRKSEEIRIACGVRSSGLRPL